MATGALTATAGEMAATTSRRFEWSPGTKNNSKRMKIELHVANLSHVPAFKNKKRAILDRKTGRMRTLTEPKAKKWMERCIQSFVCQLDSNLATTAAAMLTDASEHCSTVWLLPLDDSRQWIPEQHIYCEEVEKGSEGATITLEIL